LRVGEPVGEAGADLSEGVGVWVGVGLSVGNELLEPEYVGLAVVMGGEAVRGGWV
jgi:hypothetical protein